MQEEVENRTVNLAVSTTRLTVSAVMAGIGKYMRHRANVKARKATKTGENPKGRQTIEELIGQNQGVTSVDVAKTDLRGFEKYARKFSVDYAIVKDKGTDPTKYLCFFKARDADAITAAFNAYMNDLEKSRNKHSVLKKLSRLKSLMPKLHGREKKREREKVQER